MFKIDITIGIDQTVAIGKCHIEVELSMDKIVEEESQHHQNYRGEFREANFRGMQNYRGQNFRGGYRGNFRDDNLGRGRRRSRERQYSDNFKRNERSSSRSRSDSRVSTNRDRIQCFKCMEYNHFAKDCPNI